MNRLVDAYNAVGVLPCGGEDLDRVVVPATLKIADGTEPFETGKDGEPFVDRPAPGEVVWADVAGVTCRAWNWRQGTRARSTESTTRAYCPFDSLPPASTGVPEQAGDALEGLLKELSPGCRVERLSRPGS